MDRTASPRKTTSNDNPRSRPWLPLAALLIGQLVALLAAEAVVRRFDLSKTWVVRRNNEALREQPWRVGQTPVGFRYEPSSSFTGPGDVPYQTNSLGFRERELSRQSQHGYARIAFVGDSVTEGYGVAVQRRFTSIMSLPRTELMNFAISGHGTVDEIDTLTKHVAPLKPDLVVLQICFNDLERNDFFLAPERLGQLPKADSLQGVFQRYSALYLFLAEHYHSYLLDRGVVTPMLKRTRAVEDADLRIAIELVDKMRKSAERAGARFLAIYFPTDAETRSDERFAATFGRRILAMAHERGISAVDLTEMFRSRHESLFLDPLHLNERGHIVAAEILTQLLNARGSYVRSSSTRPSK